MAAGEEAGNGRGVGGAQSRGAMGESDSLPARPLPSPPHTLNKAREQTFEHLL